MEIQYKESYNKVFKICKNTVEKRNFNISDIQYNNGLIEAESDIELLMGIKTFKINIVHGFKTTVNIEIKAKNGLVNWVKTKIFEHQLQKDITKGLSLN